MLGGVAYHVMRRSPAACRVAPLPLFCALRSCFSTTPLSHSKDPYEGALHHEAVELITAIKDGSMQPTSLTLGLPHINGVLLSHPETGNKVFLMPIDETPDAARAARKAGALVRLVQPGLLAMCSARGYAGLLLDNIDITLPECPPGVHQTVWSWALAHSSRKAEVLQLQQECKAALGGWLPWEVRKATLRLLSQLDEELAQPLMQDDVVDLERGLVSVTHAHRVNGFFDIPRPPKKGQGLKYFLELARAYLLAWRMDLARNAGREMYELSAWIRVASREALPSTSFLTLDPNLQEHMGFLEQEGFLHALRQHKGLMLANIALDEQTMEEVAKGGDSSTILPQGLDLSLVGEAEAVGWRDLYARLQRLPEVAPNLHQYKLWESAYRFGRLAAAPPPPNLLTVALTNVVDVMLIVQKWLERFQAEEAARALAAEQQQQEEEASEAAGQPGHHTPAADGHRRVQPQKRLGRKKRRR